MIDYEALRKSCAVSRPGLGTGSEESDAAALVKICEGAAFTMGGEDGVRLYNKNRRKFLAAKEARAAKERE